MTSKAPLVFEKTRPGSAPSHLHGVLLARVEGDGFWSKVKDVRLREPPLPKGSVSSGVVVVEPDGRLWLIEPTNHFGGYVHTFPKGKLEPELTSQQNAMKEAFEETGLETRIHGFIGDFKGTTGTTRYYLARRTGGMPWTSHWETQAVKLVTHEQAKQLLNTQRDQSVLAAAERALAGR